MSRLLSLLGLVALALPAQTITGSITGSIEDSSGLPLAGAKVELKQTATGAMRETITNERGDFVFSSVNPGEYAVTVAVQGFKRYEKRGVPLSASETFAVGRIVLEVGSVADSVTVTAEGAQVQTASAERAGVIDNKQVDNLLIRSRNVMSMLQLLPGVVDNTSPDAIQRDFNINVNGNRSNTVNVSLDGMAQNAIGNNNNVLVGISQDAVAEVKVLLSNYQAEFGRMSGASVQIVTKSGTRDFHGLGSYFKRHEQFNANNFFNNLNGIRNPRYRFNTWTYNVGGPVTIPKLFNKNRDKLFFFWSQEFWPLKVNRGISRLTVPTALERRGDFSQSIDVNNRQIVVRDPDTRSPFPNNVIPTSRVDPNGAALLRIFPMPNFTDRAISGGNYNYVFAAENETPQRTETLKMDYIINQNNTVAVNWTGYLDKQTGGIGIASSGGTNWEQLRKTFWNRGNSMVGRYQRIFSPTLVNELNIGFVLRPADDIVDDAEIKKNTRAEAGFRIPNLNPGGNPLGMLPNASFGGVPNAANLTIEGRFPLETTHDSMSITDTLTKTLGSHTIKAGFYWDRIWRNAANAVVFNGDPNFGTNVNNPLDTGYAYGNAALGNFNTYTEASNRPFAFFRLSNIEWFAQDNWKVTRRFTLDYGMRFSIIQPIYNESDLVSGFQPDRWQASRAPKLITPGRVNNARVGVHPVTGAVYPAALIGAIAPGTGDVANGMVVPANDSSVPRSLIRNRGVHYAPRLGFAWDVFGNGRTALRGGAGMFYNRQNLDAVLNPFISQVPIVQTPQINFSTLAGLAGSTGVVFPQAPLGIDQEGHIPTVYNYSLSIQQRLGWGTVADMAYVGSLGRHLMWVRNLSPIPFGANFDPRNFDPTLTNTVLPAAFLRPLPGYNNVNYREFAASSNYHSFQMTVNRRFSRGLQFGGAYTWSKSMDYNSGDTEMVSVLVPVRVWNYGLSNFDRTHVARVNWVWDVPGVKNANPFVKGLLNDWQVSGILSMQSGAPTSIGFSTVTPVDITGSPTDGARIFLTGEPTIPKSERTFNRWFDTSVARLPARGTIGNAARTNLRGPGFSNWDTAVFKSFPVRELMRFQFRWELYNALNNTQFNGVNTGARFDAQGNQVNTLFGQLSSARPARVMQFSLRLYF